MPIKDDFNVSGNTEPTQISDSEREKRSQSEDYQRQLKINKIKDAGLNRKANSMLNERDLLKDNLTAQAEKKIQETADQEVRERVQPKAQHNIKPPKGSVQMSPQQRESHIRTEVRSRLGSGFKDGIDKAVQAENKKIDEFVDKALEKQRDQEKPTQQKFSENSEDITKAAKERFQERAAKRKQNQSQGGGRNRSL